MSNKEVTIRGDINRFTIGSIEKLDVCIKGGEFEPLQGDLMYVDRIKAYYFTNAGDAPVVIDGKEIAKDEFALIKNPSDFAINVGNSKLQFEQVEKEGFTGFNIKLEGPGEISMDPTLSLNQEIAEDRLMQSIYKEKDYDKMFDDEFVK